jgi:hypothetical protein
MSDLNRDTYHQQSCLKLNNSCFEAQIFFFDREVSPKRLVGSFFETGKIKFVNQKGSRAYP